MDKILELFTNLLTVFGDKMHQRCLQCRGQKYATGLGGMRKRCHECNGVGYVDITEDEEHDESYVDESAEMDDEQSEMEQAERDVEEPTITPKTKTRNRRSE